MRAESDAAHRSGAAASTAAERDYSVGRVQGWFRLLTETVGRRKHFAAPPPSPRRPAGHPHLDATQEESSSPTTSRRHHQVTAAGESERPREEGWGPPHASAGLTPCTLSVKVPRGPRGFGFSVTWSRPPRVERVDAGLPAATAGLLPGDYIVAVGSRNVVALGERGVMAAIRDCGHELPLEVYRKGTTSCLPPASSRRSLFPPGPAAPQQPAGPVPAQPAPQHGRGSGLRRCQSAGDGEQTAYYNCLLYRHAQLYPAIMASPSRHHDRFQQVTRSYLSAVVQV